MDAAELRSSEEAGGCGGPAGALGAALGRPRSGRHRWGAADRGREAFALARAEAGGWCELPGSCDLEGLTDGKDEGREGPIPLSKDWG